MADAVEGTANPAPLVDYPLTDPVEEAAEDVQASPDHDDATSEEEPLDTKPEHELVMLKTRARRKCVLDNTSKTKLPCSERIRRQEQLHPQHEHAGAKASRVKAAQLDLDGASSRLRSLIQTTNLLCHSSVPAVSSSQAREIASACGANQEELQAIPDVGTKVQPPRHD